MSGNTDNTRLQAKLYIFAISHYCEKARWALNYLDINYQPVYLAPGLHLYSTKKFGVKSTSLPILQHAGDTIQGSADIIDWAERNTDSNKNLTPASEQLACRDIEKRLDDVVGVHTRRMFYSEALVEHSATVKPIFTKDLASAQRLIINTIWPLVRKKMISAMDLGAAQGKASQAILEQELDWLDQLLADGRPYLVADHFSRADLTAASLLARLAGATQHPQAAHLILPPGIAATAQQWSERPVMQWIRELYQKHRH
ncbi:MAG: glutathione S-transferase [Pseudomonadales bacterium]|nr:glutathione S-transferase [Pseudomonadales bacterium]